MVFAVTISWHGPSVLSECICDLVLIALPHIHTISDLVDKYLFFAFTS